MIVEIGEVIKDTKKIVKVILEKNQYAIVSYTLEVHWKDEKVIVGGSSILEMEGMIKEKENLMDKDAMEIGNGESFEDT